MCRVRTVVLALHPITGSPRIARLCISKPGTIARAEPGQRMGAETRRIDQHVGERIRLRRAEAGLTQGELARALDVSYQQIQKYETGANRISAGRMYEIACTLGVGVGDFFEGLEHDGDLAPPPEHGARRRSAIELVRQFDLIGDAEIRSAVGGLVRTIVERGG